MSDYIIDGAILTDIADALREKTGAIDPIVPENMAEMLRKLERDYERGYAAGYAEGRDIWNYVRSIAGAFQNNTFPAGTNFVLNVPNLSLSNNDGNLNYIFRSTTGLESITLKCTIRGVAMHAHGAFSRCSDLKFLDLSEFNTTFGTSTDVFYSCSKLLCFLNCIFCLCTIYFAFSICHCCGCR
mgnify:CR=1 FL=1